MQRGKSTRTEWRGKREKQGMEEESKETGGQRAEMKQKETEITQPYLEMSVERLKKSKVSL